MCLCMGISLLTGCGREEKVKQEAQEPEKIFMAEFQIEPGWNMRKVQPAPSASNTYYYEDYKLQVAFDASTEKKTLDGRIKEAAGEDAQNIQLLKSEDTQVNGTAARRLTFSGIADKIVTGWEAYGGTYFVKVSWKDSEKEEAVKEIYDKTVLESFRNGKKEDTGSYFADMGQVGNLAFPLKGWEERLEDRKGNVMYETRDMETFSFVPVKGELKDAAQIEEAAGYFWNKASLLCRDVQVTEDKTEKAAVCSAGTGYPLHIQISFEEGGKAGFPGMFFKGKDGSSYCFFANTGDRKGKKVLKQIVLETKNTEKLEKWINVLWKHKMEYLGDASKTGALLAQMWFHTLGEYAFEIEADKEPYTLIIKYKPGAEKLTEEKLFLDTSLMLGLIENLDVVEVQSGKERYRLTEQEVSGDCRFYIKRIGAEKSKLREYVLSQALDI